MKKIFASLNFYILLAFVLLIISINYLSKIKEISPLEQNVRSTIISYLKSDSVFIHHLNFGYVSDTFTHKEFKKSDDSINNRKKIILGNESAYSKEGITYGLLGIFKITPNNLMFNLSIQDDNKFTDNTHNLVKQLQEGQLTSEQYIKLERDLFIKQRKIDSLRKIDFEATNSKYYLTLSNYKLKNFSNTFFIKDGKYYLKYETIDSSVKTQKGTENFATYRFKEIPFRYLIEDNRNSNSNNRICIPISKEEYKSYRIVGNLLLAILLFIGLIVLIGLPLKIAINISKGRAFISKNINYLKIIALFIFFNFLLIILSPYVIDFYYRNIIPKEFVLSTPLWKQIIDNLYILFLAICIFILSKAFAKGATIQKETDLTI